ncbi:MAG: A24 family peptidase [Phycisphaerae bacterium]
MPDYIAIVFLAVSGACIGSFLNVVIYRLPRGESIVHPGSRCTGCGNAIRWYDNIPVVGYLLLGGKCRFCRSVISPRYGLVELITAVLFVGLYDAFYKSGINVWFIYPQMDWPLFLSHLILIAVLIVCSAMDLEYYLIDVRITYVAMIAGILAWVFLPELRFLETGELSVLKLSFYGGIFGAAGGGIVRHFLLTRNSESEMPEETEKRHDREGVSIEASQSNLPGIIALTLYAAGSVGLIAWAIMGGKQLEEYNFRGLVYVAWAFLAIVAGAIPRRPADQEIVEIIEQEKSTARKTAGRELVEFFPVVIGFLAVFLLLRYVPAVGALGQKVYSLQVGPFVPVIGLSIALTGLLGAAAFGWVVRIVFTLIFGKEAMGVGDIYILAAIGAVAGGLVTIVGFFIGSVIGVLGVVVLLLWKTSRALSYGPWIAIGTLVCLLFYNPIVNYLRPMASVIEQLYWGQK